MIHQINKRSRALVGAALVAATGAAACDFVEPTTVDPNAVPTASLDQLFTTAQVNSFFFSQTEASRLSAMWTRHLEGTDRQFVSLNDYVITENDGTGAWTRVYRTGGLIDLREAIRQAEAAERHGYVGMLQIHEAFLIGMAASIWGDVPYSEAANPEIEEPALDPQLEVYDAVIALLDRAIANLQQGPGPIAPGLDMNFGSEADRWIAVANTLKARFHLHTAEVRGASAYQAALDAAESGIQEPAGNWVSIHTAGAPTEENLWFQFQRDRSGYISPNPFMIEVLEARDDPRRDIYFSEDGASIGVPATPGYNQPIITCAENHFIAAEAAFRLNNEPLAREHYNLGVACQEAEWGIELDRDVSGLSGRALFEEIRWEKWAALFLNVEAWNDFHRNEAGEACFPNLEREVGDGMPARLFYPITERNANANVPAASAQPARNPNDPNPCD